jgi:hypothetical protein
MRICPGMVDVIIRVTSWWDVPSGDPDTHMDFSDSIDWAMDSVSTVEKSEDWL